MSLTDLILPGRVIAEMRSHERYEAIAELFDHLASLDAVPASRRDQALEAFRLREEECSTGIGNGIAVPHCFLPGLSEVVAIFGRSSEGIDFQSVDHVPVHFIVLFMVPEAEHALHLRTLAVIAKHLSNAETRNRLAAATDEDDLLDVLATAP
jgi:mannitol/fructose-specific phosphotransferase system IIA component (Ntr-type)